MESVIMSIQDQRQHMAQSEAEGLEFIGPCPSNLCEAWVDIPLPDGLVNRTKVVWPKHSDGRRLRCSLVVYFHGGGFAACSPDLVLAPARGFASVFSCVVACPSINQYPEHPFPAPVRIAWEVCAWLSDANNLNSGVLRETGAEINLSRGFVVGGLSAGGTAAAVIAGIAGSNFAKVKDFAGLSTLKSPITGVFSGLPMLVTEAMIPAQYKADLRPMEEHAKDQHESIAMLRDLEKRLGGAVHSLWFSPINMDLSNSSVIQHHPKRVFTYSCALDPLRDHAIIYKKWVSKLPGVEAQLCVVEGEKHTILGIATLASQSQSEDQGDDPRWDGMVTRIRMGQEPVGHASVNVSLEYRGS